MSPRHVLMAMIMGLALAACEGRQSPAPVAALRVAAVLEGEDARDVHSFAEPLVARVTHVDLDLRADFAARVLSGTATLQVQSSRDDPVLTLDTRGLQIEAVTDAKGRPLRWQPGEADPIRGTPLRITLGGTRSVQVRYRTAAGAEALQWLVPAQTAGKRQPFLYSQGQAILTRTWVPTQDSPGIRQTWSARIVAPRDLTVVMSAEALGDSPGPDAGTRAWRFRMDHPVAPYLIAVAIGDLQFRAVGQRTGVYAEPSVIEAAASEFRDMEAMLTAAEALYGPYRWGRYDVLVLPPAFPFGGMENPRLTFLTPTLLAGDRSLVSVVAHELAHSWSGNLVTNATWADFWLNEGFTNYFESRIMERVYGREAAAMQLDLAWDGLQSTIQEMGGPQAADTRLHGDFAGRNPDDGVNDIAYEKGATFLRTIEAAVGRERWDAFLKDYFDRHAFQPQTSARFLADLRANLIRGDAQLEHALQLDAWVYQPGLPPNAVHVQAAAFRAVDAAAVAFMARGELPMVEGWSSAERERFLSKLTPPLKPARLESLVRLLQLDRQRNAEVRFAWLSLAIRSRYEPALPDLTDFLTTVGRRKYVLPLYAALVEQGEWGRSLAQRLYATARPGYHAVTANSVDKLLDSVPRENQ